MFSFSFKEGGLKILKSFAPVQKVPTGTELILKVSLKKYLSCDPVI